MKPLPRGVERAVTRLWQGYRLFWGKFGPWLVNPEGRAENLHLGTARALVNRKLVLRTKAGWVLTKGPQ